LFLILPKIVDTSPLEVTFPSPSSILDVGVTTLIWLFARTTLLVLIFFAVIYGLHSISMTVLMMSETRSDGLVSNSQIADECWNEIYCYMLAGSLLNLSFIGCDAFYRRFIKMPKRHLYLQVDVFIWGMIAAWSLGSIAWQSV